MKKVTVNGNDHELSPDSPRSRSHVELLQDMVTSINNLETGTSPDGLELTSTDAAVNVISSASNDATTTASVAALTFKNTVAHATNDLEYNFTRSDDTSLLKIDKEGDVTAAGSLSAPTVNVTGTAGLVVTGSTTTAVTLPAGSRLNWGSTNLEESSTVITCGTTLAASTMQARSGDPISIRGRQADGATAVGVILDATTALANANAKLVSVRNATTEKAYVTTNGSFVTSGHLASTGGVQTTALTTPVAGAFTTATTGGTLADATNYYYRISAINDIGESLACAEVTQATGAGPTGTHTITAVWGTVAGATGYNVYGRTTGAEQFIATVAQGTLSYTDDGSISPSGALPTHNTTSGLRMTALTPNVITSATNASNASATVAATTFKNTAALDANDLEFNFVRSDDTSLLKVDKEGDTTVAGSFTCAGLNSSGATTALTSASANVITSAASDANTTAAVAGLTFKNTVAHTSGDLEFNFTRSDNTSLLSVDTSGVTTAANILQTNGTAIRILNPGAYETWGTGGVSATSPACTFITKSALTAGYLNFGFNRSDGTQLVTIRNEGQVSLPQLGGTSASATGITTNAAAELRTFVQKVTVTEAALTDADTSQAVTIWTAPAKTRILRIVADVTAAFTGGGVTACTLQVGISGGDADAYIVASDVFSGAVTLGDVEADLGVALSNAGTGAGAFPDFTTTKAIAAQFDSTTANVADLTAGSVTFYIEYCTYA